MALHKHNSPEEFTSTTDLPQKLGGGPHEPEGDLDTTPTISGGGLPVEKDRFLGTRGKDVKINDDSEMKFMGSGGVRGGNLEGVDQDFKRIP